MANELHTLFNYRPMKDLAGFLTSYNVASQVVAFADENPATTGTKMCAIDGVIIPSLTAEDDADWDHASTAVSGDAAGRVAANLYSLWHAVFADEDGLLTINEASNYALDAAVVLKVPDFDYETLVCIGLAALDFTGASTIGTTDNNGITTVYQVLGPIFPHPDNIDLN